MGWGREEMVCVEACAVAVDAGLAHSSVFLAVGRSVGAKWFVEEEDEEEGM